MRCGLCVLMFMLLIPYECSMGIEKVPLEEDIFSPPKEVVEKEPLGTLEEKISPIDEFLSLRNRRHSIASRDVPTLKKRIALPSRKSIKVTKKRVREVNTKEAVSPPRGSRPRTVGEVVAAIIPKALHKEEVPLPIEDIGGREVADTSAQEPTPAPPQEETSGIKRNLSFVISGIGLAGLVGVFVGLFLVGNLRRDQRGKKEPRGSKERDLSSELIYKEWLKDDIRNLRKTYREMIQGLTEKVKRERLEIDDRFAKIDRRLEELNSRLKGSPREAEGGNLPYEEIVELAKEGFSVEEIARMTKMGRQEVDFILKRYSNR